MAFRSDNNRRHAALEVPIKQPRSFPRFVLKRSCKGSTWSASASGGSSIEADPPMAGHRFGSDLEFEDYLFSTEAIIVDIIHVTFWNAYFSANFCLLLLTRRTLLIMAL